MSFRVRDLAPGLCALLMSSVLAVPSPAQFQNPITAAKDAYKKAKEQQKQQQQQQQQQQQPTQATTAAAAATPASSTTATAGTQAAAPWTPPTDEPAVAVKLDPLKLPDVVGVRLGMTGAEALAAVRKQYPTDIYEKLAVDWWPSTQKPDYGYTVVSSSPGNAADVHLSYTAPPGPQLLWRLERFTYHVNINHGTMLAALRAKYGKETVGLNENGGDVARDDRGIAQLYWMYNERGDRIPIPPSQSTNAGMIGECWGPSSPQPVMPADDSQVANYKGWCATIVYLHVTISTQEIVQFTTTELTDVPLAIRTAHAAGAYQARVAEEQRRQQIEKSKTVTPTL
jgi:hypothetical protein